MISLTYPISSPSLYKGDKECSEMLPVTGKDGIIIGRASRQYCHSPKKPMHPVIHLHIINRNGDVFLQHRSADKLVCPSMWDTAVGGHVTYGEHLEEALYREAEEELGFYDFNPQHILTYVFESDIECELVTVFATVGNFDLSPHNEEVMEGRWWTVKEIDETMGKGILTPNFESEFKKIRHKLQALL